MRGVAAVGVLVLVWFSGCTSPGTEPVTVEPARDDAPPPLVMDGVEYERNSFLLGAPLPQVTDVSNGAEPSILVDQAGNYIFLGDTSGLYRSSDGGASFQELGFPFIASADGWPIAQDATGRIYIATTNLAAIEVASSSNYGSSWEVQNHAVDISPIADRPWIAARGDGEVIVFYYDFGKGFGETCLRSKDKGATFLDRGYLQASPQGGNAVYDDAGNAYFSEDGGNVYRFGSSCLGPAVRNFFPGGMGPTHMIQVATNGQAIYAAAASPGGDQVRIAGSRDFGSIKHLDIGPPQIHQSTFMSITAKGEDVAIAWYGSETAGDPNSPSFRGSWNVFVAYVQDFWTDSPAVTYTRLTEEPNHVGEICMDGIGCDGSRDRDLLDYIMADFDPDGGVHVAFGNDGVTSVSKDSYAYVPPPSVAYAPTGADPVPAFSAETDGLKVVVDGTESTSPNGNIKDFRWDWGDKTAKGKGAKTSHTYAKAGTYLLTLTITDDHGRKGTETAEITVAPESKNKSPTASFSVDPESPHVDEEARFSDTSEDQDGRVVSRLWEFGDGGTATDAAPTHTYTHAGSFVVRLQIVDDGGARAHKLQSIKVQAKEETAPPATEDGNPQAAAPPKRAPGAPALIVVVLVALLLAARRRPPMVGIALVALILLPTMANAQTAALGVGEKDAWQWHVKAVRARTVHHAMPGPTAPVAVLDSGIDFTHPDLDHARWINPEEIAANGLDDDANGYVDDVHGWDFCLNLPAADRTSAPFGTFVAGLIAADGADREGAIGVSPGAPVMDLRILCDPLRPQEPVPDAFLRLRDALRYARAEKTPVIHISLLWNTVNTTVLPETIASIQDEIEGAHADGLLLVAGAGNTKGGAVAKPASFQEVLAVGATGLGNGVPQYSARGPEIDLWAPGGSDAPSDGSFHRSMVFSTSHNGSYAWDASTVAAAAHVAGAASWVRALEPDLSPDAVVQRLQSTAWRLPTGESMVDVAAAVGVPYTVPQAHILHPEADKTIASRFSPQVAYTRQHDVYSIELQLDGNSSRFALTSFEGPYILMAPKARFEFSVAVFDGRVVQAAADSLLLQYDVAAKNDTDRPLLVHVGDEPNWTPRPGPLPPPRSVPGLEFGLVLLGLAALRRRR